MTLEEKQRTLIEDLNLIPDPHERLAALGSRSGAFLLPDEEKHDSLLVPGCVSRVWLHGRLQDGQCRFRCEADSPMVRSLVVLLCQLYDDASPAEVAVTEPELWRACGFDKMLSPTRLNGLASVRSRIRAIAEGLLQA